MKRTIFAFTAILALGFQAQAARQAVSCVSTDKEWKGATLKMSFDPDVKIETIWKKNKDKRDYIEMIKVGDEDSSTTTTAKAVVTTGKAFKDEYAKPVKLVEYYEVNSANKGSEGYGYKFGNKAYRSFHGHPKHDLWDVMAYIPEEIIGESSKEFPALVTMQADLMDQGYYHIDMKCKSIVRK